MESTHPIIYDGKKYWLTGDAYYCGERPAYCEFDDWGYGDDEGVPIGKSYIFKMVAPAIDENSKVYKIYWEFEDIKGNEHDLDWFDYYDQENIMRITEL